MVPWGGNRESLCVPHDMTIIPSYGDWEPCRAVKAASTWRDKTVPLPRDGGGGMHGWC
jgi:hypothetical protein